MLSNVYFLHGNVHGLQGSTTGSHSDHVRCDHSVVGDCGEWRSDHIHSGRFVHGHAVHILAPICRADSTIGQSKPMSTFRQEMLCPVSADHVAAGYVCARSQLRYGQDRCGES